MGVNKKKKEGHVPLVIDDGGVVESSTQGMQTSMKSFFKPAVVTKAGRKRKGKSNAGRKPAVVEGQDEKKQRLIKEVNELKQENLDKAVAAKRESTATKHRISFHNDRPTYDLLKDCIEKWDMKSDVSKAVKSTKKDHIQWHANEGLS